MPPFHGPAGWATTSPAPSSPAPGTPGGPGGGGTRAPRRLARGGGGGGGVGGPPGGAGGGWGNLPAPAGRAMNQRPLALGESAVVEERLPGAERRQRHRRRLGVAERSRLGREHRDRDRGVVSGYSVTVERGHPEHLVTDGHTLTAGPEGSHDAGQLIRGDRRKPVDGPLELVARERRGADAHQRLSEARSRHRDLLADQLLGAAGSSQNHRSHRRQVHLAASAPLRATVADTLPA